MRQACGTMYTVSSEMLVNDNGYSEKSDVWSVRCISYVLLSNKYPFLRDTDDIKDEEHGDGLLRANYVFGPA